MPPTPKPPSQRRRRNAGQAQWRELPAEGRRGSAPELPGEGWLPSTVSWWQTIWRSPMATAWLPADVDALERLVQLRDQQYRGDLPISGLAAMQALEDRFGLNPKARRTLQWEIARGAIIDHPTRLTERQLRAVDSTE
jgi:hypothetical protein